MNITEDYVSFEVAKLLKEKGFDGLCYCHEFTDYEGNFTTYHTEYPENWNLSEPCVSIPTLGMAMKWLREVHKVNIEIHYNRFGENYKYIIIYKPVVLDDIHSLGVYFHYEEAVEASLKYVLKNLI